MPKRVMKEIKVYSHDGLIVLLQDEESEFPQQVEMTPEQASLVVQWIEDAKAEIQSLID